MKYLVILLFTGLIGQAQISADSAKKLIKSYRLGYSSYFDPFIGKAGYGAPWIISKDGNVIVFGDNTLIKVASNGKEMWKRTLKPIGDETECQSVAEDVKGNLYTFMLVYDQKKYRGGCERVVCYDKTGKLLWDKYLGTFTLLNNPTVSYIKPDKEGKIYMRGHVAKDKPAEGKDPVYLYWEGWLDVTGKLTQKAGEAIDWKQDKWQKIFKPE
ncbi:MAG: hypothetical protein ACK50A_10175 [Sphingobacteriaceae bacterium]